MQATKTYRLYSVRRVQRGKLESERLVVDSGDLTSVGDLKWSDLRTKFDALADGSSSLQGDWRIVKLPDYRSGAIMYDSHAKEYVMISNGSCVLSHFDEDARYRADHPSTDAPCVFAPSEAIALRPMVQRDGSVLIGFTHRAVDPCKLERTTKTQEDEQKILFKIAMDPAGMSIDKKQAKQYIGRI